MQTIKQQLPNNAAKHLHLGGTPRQLHYLGIASRMDIRLVHHFQSESQKGRTDYLRSQPRKHGRAHKERTDKFSKKRAQTLELVENYFFHVLSDIFYAGDIH